MTNITGNYFNSIFKYAYIFFILGDDIIPALAIPSKPYDDMNYEEKRAFNIRKNQEMLRQLGIPDLTADIGNMAIKKPPEPKNNSRKRSQSPDSSISLSDHDSDISISTISDDDKEELEDLPEWDKDGNKIYWKYVGKVFCDRENPSCEWVYWQIYSVAKYYTFSGNSMYVWRYIPYGAQPTDQNIEYSPCDEMLEDPNVNLDYGE